MKKTTKYILWATGAFLAIAILYYISASKVEYVAPVNSYVETTTQTGSVSSNNSSAFSTSGTESIPVSPLEKCEVAQKTKAEKDKTQYEKGTLLATFAKTVSFKSALETLAANSLGYKSEAQSETDFEKNHWLTVTVPSGQEFKWLCVLSDSADIQFVGLNEIFNLHQ